MDKLMDHEIGILNHLISDETSRLMAVGPYKEIDHDRIATLHHIRYVLNHT